MLSFRRQFPSWDRLAPELAAGLINGVIAIILELSFAVLIFSGPLANRVSVGIGLTLFGTLVISRWWPCLAPLGESLPFLRIAQRLSWP
jgi:hypothetical protein